MVFFLLLKSRHSLIKVKITKVFYTGVLKKYNLQITWICDHGSFETFSQTITVSTIYEVFQTIQIIGITCLNAINELILFSEKIIASAKSWNLLKLPPCLILWLTRRHRVDWNNSTSSAVVILIIFQHLSRKFLQIIDDTRQMICKRENTFQCYY